MLVQKAGSVVEVTEDMFKTAENDIMGIEKNILDLHRIPGNIILKIKWIEGENLYDKGLCVQYF